MSDLKTSIIIELVNRVTEPVRRISRSFEGLRRAAVPAMADVNTKAANLAGSIGSLTAKLGLLGGAGVWGFKRQFIDTASEFEQFKAVLETVERSSEKAHRSMTWVSDFAAKTPFELGEVTDAFVKLRAYGMDPMQGLLKSIGDVAAGGNRSMIQGVEAVADAVMGNFERLKEFSSITAETKGNKVRFGYQDASGQQQYKIVDKKNRAIIASTLQAIWNEQYEGAMEKQSRTWKGMMSNLSDQWTRFKVKVMEAGLFDWMKGKLGDLLVLVDKMAANGNLDRYARLWGTKIKSGMQEAYRVGVSLWRGFVQIKSAVDKVAEAMGGYDKLLKAVAATVAANFLVQIGLLTLSLVNLANKVIPALNTSLKTLGITLGPIAKTLTILYGIEKYALDPLGMGVDDFKESWKKYQDSVSKMMEMLSGKRDWKNGELKPPHRSPLIESESSRRSAENERMNAYVERIAATKMMGELKITIDRRDQMRVTHMRGQNLDMDVDVGRMMVMPV